MSSSSPDPVAAILRSLAAVDQERERRGGVPGLAGRVRLLKTYQQERFRRTYADLLASPRYTAAAGFFLEELYGPRDFSSRDAQFARIVPAISRMFAGEIVHTVSILAELHALSESLDGAMGDRLPGADIDAQRYACAWQVVGRAADREQQIALTLQVGAALDRYTRMPMLGMSLRMMRGPARAAGLSDLQGFLETGFGTFKAMGGADAFLQVVGERERALARALFDEDVAAASGQLP